MNNYLKDKRAPGVKLQLGANSYGYPSGGLPVRVGAKSGGWIQEATKGMRKDKPCTGKKFGSKTCPKGSRRYNLAKTFKSMARKRAS
jgi:hypothetical protein